MDRVRSIKLKWLYSELGQFAYELSRIHYSQLVRAGGWTPAVNAFRCERCIRVCFDLAGVDRAQIDLKVEPGRLVLRGTRPPPEPAGSEPRAQQILALEIDYGPFIRELGLPAEVDPEQVTAEQNNGLLWVNLPLRHCDE